jgi:voltage-gated potassium channel
VFKWWHSDWHVLERFRLPLAMLAFAGLYGVVGYMWIFGWQLIDALYMTVITLTTVGYREVEPVETVGSKLFTISLLIIGISAVFAGIGVLANMIGSGELSGIARRRRARREVKGMNDHYIVCAYGRVGRAVVGELRRQGVPFVVVDTDPNLEARFQKDGVSHVIADPSEEQVLLDLGVERAQALVCAVDSDEVNVYITLTARALNPNLTIVARASRRQTRHALEKAGADHVISPYELSGRRMASLSLRPSLIDFIEMLTVGPGLRLDEIVVRDGSPLVGQVVGEIKERYQGVTILALKRASDEELAAPPDESMVLASGDLVVAFGPRIGLEAMETITA